MWLMLLKIKPKYENKKLVLKQSQQNKKI